MTADGLVTEPLNGVVGAYDVRGKVPGELDADTMYCLGAAFADCLIKDDKSFVIGRDMRASGVELAQAFACGVASRGVGVTDIGLCSTDQLYFAAQVLDAFGAMVTASHNPAEYNGVKLCRPGAAPISIDTGLGEIRNRAAELLSRGTRASLVCAPVREDLLGQYAQRLLELCDVSEGRPLKIVVDAGSGMAGLTVPAVLGDVPGIEIIGLNMDLDGTFPVHEANPLDPANTQQLQQAVVEYGADLGLAFDGDADRCFVVDEHGRRVSPSALTVLVGLAEAKRARSLGEESPLVLHNLITSRAVSELLQASGIRTLRTPVGHSHIKRILRENDAVFAGEHSGHFYFRDFGGVDSGLLTALHVIRALRASDGGIAQMVEQLSPYSASGEINYRVRDAQWSSENAVRGLCQHWGANDIEIDRLDGVTITHWMNDPRWWVNLRPSNTEPLLRCNIEAADQGVLEQLVDQVKHLIEQEG